MAVNIKDYRDKITTVLGRLECFDQSVPIRIERRTINADIISTDILNEQPVLYWFLMTEKGGLSNGAIAEEYNEQKKSNKGYSAVNVSKAEENHNSVCLYVGKVRSNFRERLKVHLGLGNNKQTKGLRLKTWLPPSMIVQLHYVKLNLPKGDEFLVDPFEVHLKKELKPIIGVK